jgi:hypothetical protein
MSRLGRVLVEAIVHHYGRDEFLRRLSHPFWFQSFGSVMGMDWHSSGITTSVIGALKRGLNPVRDELGIYVCGGRGRHSRKTPDELRALGDQVGVDGEALTRTSRLIAKVDSAAVQDEFQIYLHSFIVTRDGNWTVVQQGMNPERGQARRYHWLSEHVTSFVDEPHAAIDGPNAGTIVNLTDRRARRNRDGQLELVARGPDRALAALAKPLPQLCLPGHHEVRAEDIVNRRLRGVLAAAADRGPKDFPALLLTPGVGARTVRALALASEIVHGGPSRFTDPARYSIAHGGKDGHPFPVPLKVYDKTIAVLRHAIDQAKLGNDDKLSAIKKLDDASRRLERLDGDEIDVAAFFEEERRASYKLGGRTVKGWATQHAEPAKTAVPKNQLALW